MRYLQALLDSWRREGDSTRLLKDPARNNRAQSVGRRRWRINLLVRREILKFFVRRFQRI
jgi:hypothetical protein